MQEPNYMSIQYTAGMSNKERTLTKTRVCRFCRHKLRDGNSAERTNILIAGFFQARYSLHVLNNLQPLQALPCPVPLSLV